LAPASILENSKHGLSGTRYPASCWAKSGRVSAASCAARVTASELGVAWNHTVQRGKLGGGIPLKPLNLAQHLRIDHKSHHRTVHFLPTG